MKITVAKTSGFCMGVKRAMQLASHTAKDGTKVYAIGPLIHNPQAIEGLKEQGVGMIGHASEAQAGDTIIIRAHGVTKEVLKSLENAGANIVDATCPHVVTSQKQIKKYSDLGYKIIIVGDPKHPEIESLSSFATDGILVKDFEAAAELGALDQVMIIAQTTYNAQEFNKIAEFLQGQAQEAVISNSICLATSKRQEEIKSLASASDAVIIVGGKNSANTRRLAEIAAEYCKNVKHIETEGELKPEDYANCERVGISAGASTPEFITARVVKWLENL